MPLKGFEQANPLLQSFPRCGKIEVPGSNRKK
jgi:hypothetical protein